MSILRIYPPPNLGGLKFEPDPRGIGSAFHGEGVEIGQKGGVLQRSRIKIEKTTPREKVCKAAFMYMKDRQGGTAKACRLIEKLLNETFEKRPLLPNPGVRLKF